MTTSTRILTLLLLAAIVSVAPRTWDVGASSRRLLELRSHLRGIRPLHDYDSEQLLSAARRGTATTASPPSTISNVEAIVVLGSTPAWQRVISSIAALGDTSDQSLDQHSVLVAVSDPELANEITAVLTGAGVRNEVRIIGDESTFADRTGIAATPFVVAMSSNSQVLGAMVGVPPTGFRLFPAIREAIANRKSNTLRFSGAMPFPTQEPNGGS